MAVAVLVMVTACAAGRTVQRPPQRAPQGNVPDLRLMLNIPASRIDVYERGKRTHTYEVSAGSREFSTPAGKYRISQVTWNPWWHPPNSKWARDEKPTPPGPDNPMGRVKLNFASLLYIHGTPFVDDLGTPASHGCIRMHDRDLIELTRIIHKYRTPRVPGRLIAELEKSPTMTRTFHIKPVPFEVAYRLVEVRDDKLIIHPDVYRTAGTDLHAELVAALKQEGIEVTPGLEEHLGAISKKRNATRLTVALDSLVNAAAGE
jgi:murein L,D-transpeptidase YcbB/YkuD